MPRFDIPGRKAPTKIVMHPEGRERIFPLPYTTEDPADIALLSKHPGIVATPTPGPPAEPAPEEDPKPLKSSRKEV